MTDVDPTQDTPIDILHTFLLGVVKYVWWRLHTAWSLSQKELFAARLESLSKDALGGNPMPAKYILRYPNSLIGKHFKTLVQTWAFALDGLADMQMMKLAQASSELGFMLWIHTIDNMDTYLVSYLTLI